LTDTEKLFFLLKQGFLTYIKKPCFSIKFFILPFSPFFFFRIFAPVIVTIIFFVIH